MDKENKKLWLMSYKRHREMEVFYFDAYIYTSDKKKLLISNEYKKMADDVYNLIK